MRCAVIEIGHWHSGQYVSGLERLGERIVAVSDHDLAVARAKSDGLECRVYANHLELIEKERPDFVFAHGMHCDMTEIASDLVDSNIPFVMEKPMGVDWEQLTLVADTAEQKGLFAGVDLVMRCYRLTRELLQLRHRDEFGQVTAYTQRLFAGTPDRYHRWSVPWVLERHTAGGGPLFNFGPHVLDLLFLLSGQDVESVFCRSSHALHGLGVEDCTLLSLRLSDGAVATIEVGYVCPDSQYDHFLSICTDKLFLSTTNYDAGQVSFRDGHTLELGRENALQGLDYVSETLRRYRNGQQPVASIRDMCRVLRVINAAQQSAQAGLPVELG